VFGNSERGVQTSEWTLAPGSERLAAIAQDLKEFTMTLDRRAASIAALLFATSAWGSLFVVGKAALRHVDPVWLTLLRYTIATLGFAALLAARRQPIIAMLRAHGRRLALLGFAGYGLFSVLVLEGLAHSVPSHGAVVMATMPITTQLLRWLLDGQRPQRSSLFGALLALTGVVMVSGIARGGAAGASTLPGDLTAWLGTLGWITYTRHSARFPALDPLEYGGLTAIASWPLLLLLALLSAPLHLSTLPSPEALRATWAALLYMAAVPTVLAVLAYNFGVRTLGVVSGTAFLNMVPISALTMSVALGHAPQAHELAGAALVIAALLLHVGGQRPVRTAPCAAAGLRTAEASR
jgi:drug/metabolite transporter (DMT)-like permease